MVAFTVLAQGAHDFAEAHGRVPQAFYHDQQGEFGNSMREHVKLFGRLSIKQPEITMPVQASDFVKKDYDLGKFSMPSSKDYAPLQAVDVLLWVMQRDDDAEFAELRGRIHERAEPFYISRGISELIRFAGLKMLAERPLSDAELLRGKEIREQMEAKFQKDLQEFSRKGADGR
jgi:hypothetical protein